MSRATGFSNNSGPQNHRVFERPAVVPRPSAHVSEPELLVQAPRGVVRLAYFEIHRLHAPIGEQGEETRDERASDAATPVRGRDAEVQDLRLVRRVVRHGVAGDHTVLLSHEKRDP